MVRAHNQNTREMPPILMIPAADIYHQQKNS